jgi:hypothetical protein
MSSNHKKVIPFEKKDTDAVKPNSRAELELLVKKARELAKGAPQRAAIILTNWLNRPRKLENMRKKAG